MSPDFIPHSKFHKGIWLLPVSKPRWYYFMEKPNNNIISNIHFMDSVDEPLKELIVFLHSNRIRTTPSCAGHNFRRKVFVEIYQTLRKEEKWIKEKGLSLQDIESGKIFIFKDKKYNLPWDCSQFVEQAHQYQRKGIIGIRFTSGDQRIERLISLNIPGATIYRRDLVVFISISIHRKTERDGMWKLITGEIKRVLRDEVSHLYS